MFHWTISGEISESGKRKNINNSLLSFTPVMFFLPVALIETSYKCLLFYCISVFNKAHIYNHSGGCFQLTLITLIDLPGGVELWTMLTHSFFVMVTLFALGLLILGTIP